MICQIRKIASLLALVCCSGTLLAAEFKVAVEIPRLEVAEYHRPYVAMWLTAQDGQTVHNLNVLYDVDLANAEGQKWLKDLRQWWRRSGRSLQMPVDGVSGATRAPARHDFDFSNKVTELPPGDYQLTIEVVREVGGRELLEFEFNWPPTAPEQLQAKGETELGEVVLSLAP